METKESFGTKILSITLVVLDVIRQIGGLFLTWIGGLLLWSVTAVLKSALSKIISIAGGLVALYFLHLFIK